MGYSSAECAAGSRFAKIIGVTDFGKILIGFGLLVAALGGLIVLAGRSPLHFPMGRLPGDIVYRGKRATIYFPLMTSIILSIVLTLVFWLVGRAGGR